MLASASRGWDSGSGVGNSPDLASEQLGWSLWPGQGGQERSRRRPAQICPQRSIAQWSGRQQHRQLGPALPRQNHSTWTQARRTPVELAASTTGPGDVLEVLVLWLEQDCDYEQAAITSSHSRRGNRGPGESREQVRPCMTQHRTSPLTVLLRTVRM